VFYEREAFMIKRNVEDFRLQGKKERDFVSEIKTFVKGERCYNGNILVLHGLRRTGKSIAMEQVVSELSEQMKCAFYEVEDTDTMSEIREILFDEKKNGTTLVCFDEITKAEDFISRSASLPDVFAKMGMRIIVTGTDSLGFRFAENYELYGRTKQINTTHIPFAEHCRVLGTNDIDDYIQYGGLMQTGKDNDTDFVYDYESARKYLDSAVAENISRSIKKSDEGSELEQFTITELRAIIEKMVELYSGKFNEKIIQSRLKNVSVNFPVNKLGGIVDEDIIRRLFQEDKNITRDFAEIINAETPVKHPVTESTVRELEGYLLDMNVLSAIPHIQYRYEKQTGWHGESATHEVYLIQPAIKYYHLQKGKQFIMEKPYYSELSKEVKRFMGQKLEEKIKGDMTEQIIAFDVSKALPYDRYDVVKPSFTIEGQSGGEYDMLVYDKKDDLYWGFEIKHTTNAFYKQEQHLQNDFITAFMDKKYGKREHVCVLYRGNPFVSSTGTIYLNITDFCLAVDKYRDMEKVFEELSKDLETRNLVAEYKAQTDEEVGKETDGILNKKQKSNDGIGRD
jgi:predicted AAA+ superfamily ATPase